MEGSQTIPGERAVAPRKNPFVGPVPLTQEDPIFGRDREIRELYDKLISQRIVVLHSPSGAGKTSLVMAGLLPRLKDEGLLLLPVIRVGGEPEMNFQPPDKFNPYIYNLVLALDSSKFDEPVEERPSEDRHQRLANMSLAEYLDRHAADQKDVPRAFVFDQFEEIITSTLAGTELKREFFRQVGEALRDRTLWALFAIREDYLGALEPYAALIPTQFSNTFRLDFLDYTAALEAVRKPLDLQGIMFIEQADEQLVNDLRTVLVQTPDGEIRTEEGEYVEPVQLQVVCRRLYDRLDLERRLDKTQVDRHDLESVGDVDEALKDFYRDQVKRVGEVRSVERHIRDWFEKYLITKTGLRGQVMMEKDISGGLENNLIRDLVDAHLVRSDKRRGVTWFELAHDRLVQPVLADNDAWRKTELDRLQQQAWEWRKQFRPDALLLRGKELIQAQAWAEAHPEELDGLDNEFLDKSGVWRREHLSWVQVKASQWQEKGRPAGMLLAGDDLAQAENWVADNSLEMTEDEAAFVAESRKQQTEQERIQQQAKRTAETRRSRLIIGCTVVAVFAVACAISTVVLSLSARLVTTANSTIAAQRDADTTQQAALIPLQKTGDQIAKVEVQVGLTVVAQKTAVAATEELANIPPHVRQSVTEFITTAANAEIEAYAKQDARLASSVYTGALLEKVQNNIKYYTALGLISHATFYPEDTYIVSISYLDDQTLLVEDCESWSTSTENIETGIVMTETAQHFIANQLVLARKPDGGWIVTGVYFPEEPNYCSPPPSSTRISPP